MKDLLFNQRWALVWSVKITNLVGFAPRFNSCWHRDSHNAASGRVGTSTTCRISDSEVEAREPAYARMELCSDLPSVPGHIDNSHRQCGSTGRTCIAPSV